MKIIHCADLHLDSAMKTSLTPTQAAQRRTELLGTFVSMVDYAAQNGVTAVLIAGDLFDKKRVSVRARTAVYQEIADNPEIGFYYLRGNHDPDVFLDSLENLPSNLKMFGNSWITYELGKNVTVSGLELTSKNALLAAQTLVLDRNKFNIVMLHGQESAAGAGGDQLVPLGELGGHFIDYLALGHIHAHKCAALDARGIYCYSGCLEGRGFDEPGEHGFELLMIDEETRKFNHSFVPFARRNIFVEQVDVTGCVSPYEALDKIESVMAKKTICEKDMAKFVLTGECGISKDLNPVLIERILSDRLYCVRVEDATRQILDYERLSLGKSLRAEFVRCVMASDLDDEKKALVIKMGLLSMDGEELEICSW